MSETPKDHGMGLSENIIVMPNDLRQGATVETPRASASPDASEMLAPAIPLAAEGRDTLIERLAEREQRLRTLADDPYAGGTERSDADLLREARAALDAKDHAGRMMGIALREAEAQIRRLEIERDAANLHAQRAEARVRELTKLAQDRAQEITDFECREERTDEALEKLEQEMRKASWPDDFMPMAPVTRERVGKWADTLRALRRSPEGAK